MWWPFKRKDRECQCAVPVISWYGGSIEPGKTVTGLAYVPDFYQDGQDIEVDFVGVVVQAGDKQIDEDSWEAWDVRADQFRKEWGK